MQKLFPSWKKRKLTIFGKACVVNSLGTSQLINKAPILPFPDPEYSTKEKKHIYLFFCGTNMIECKGHCDRGKDGLRGRFSLY